MDRIFFLTQTKARDLLEKWNWHMNQRDYQNHIDSLIDWNNKYHIEYAQAKKKLTNINESYSSIKTNFWQLVDAPADHPIHEITEKDCEESLSEDDHVYGLKDALKERVDTFSIPEPLNVA